MDAWAGLSKCCGFWSSNVVGVVLSHSTLCVGIFEVRVVQESTE